MNEKWKNIEGMEGRYQVSNMGRVRSLPRIDCRGYKIRGRIITIGVRGKRVVAALRRDGACAHYALPQLVARAFVPNPSGLPVVTHKDGDITNNVANNLVWTSKSEVARSARK